MNARCGVRTETLSDPAAEQGLEHGGGQDENPRCGVRHRLEVRRLPDVLQEEPAGRQGLLTGVVRAAQRPRATPDDVQQVEFRVMDLVRYRDGQWAEHWAVADAVSLLRQTGGLRDYLKLRHRRSPTSP